MKTAKNIIIALIIVASLLGIKAAARAESPVTVTRHSLVTDYNPHTGVTLYTHHVMGMSTGKVFYSQILAQGAQPVAFPEGTTTEEKRVVDAFLGLLK